MKISQLTKRLGELKTIEPQGTISRWYHKLVGGRSAHILRLIEKLETFLKPLLNQNDRMFNWDERYYLATLLFDKKLELHPDELRFVQMLKMNLWGIADDGLDPPISAHLLHAETIFRSLTRLNVFSLLTPTCCDAVISSQFPEEMTQSFVELEVQGLLSSDEVIEFMKNHKRRPITSKGIVLALHEGRQLNTAMLKKCQQL